GGRGGGARPGALPPGRPAELAYDALRRGEARAGRGAQVADQVLDLAERPRRGGGVGALERQPREPAPCAQHVLDQALDRLLLPAVVLARLGEPRPQPGEVE